MINNLKFYKNKILLNVLAKDIDNIKEIVEATDDCALIGVLAADFATIDAGIQYVQQVKSITNNISVGLGDGDSSQSYRAIDIALGSEVPHLNQTFTSFSYAKGALRIKGRSTLVNVLVNPTGVVGKVNIAVGEKSSKFTRANIDIDTAVAMILDMKGDSIKFFPMGGSKSLEELKAVVKSCQKHGIRMIEPTGGINLDNFNDIVSVCLDSGIEYVIPHVYNSIINKETGKTNIEDIQKLYDNIKKLVG